MNKWWMEQPQESESKYTRYTTSEGVTQTSKLYNGEIIEKENVKFKVDRVLFLEDKFYYLIKEN